LYSLQFLKSADADQRFGKRPFPYAGFPGPESTQPSIFPGPNILRFEAFAEQEPEEPPPSMFDPDKETEKRPTGELLYEETEKLRKTSEPALPPLLHGPGANVWNFKAYMAQAHKLFKQGKYTHAAARYETAKRALRDKPAAHIAHGHALLASGDYHTAALMLQRALKVFPQWVNARLDLAGTFARAEDLKRREKEIGEQLAQAPKSVTHNFMMGYIYWYTGRRDEAIPFFEKVVEVSKGAAATSARLFLEQKNPKATPAKD
jgi:tetratricopeptide (TPR) repeat protein